MKKTVQLSYIIRNLLLHFISLHNYLKKSHTVAVNVNETLPFLLN